LYVRLRPDITAPTRIDDVGDPAEGVLCGGFSRTGHVGVGCGVQCYSICHMSPTFSNRLWASIAAATDTQAEKVSLLPPGSIGGRTLGRGAFAFDQSAVEAQACFHIFEELGRDHRFGVVP